MISLAVLTILAILAAFILGGAWAEAARSGGPRQAVLVTVLASILVAGALTVAGRIHQLERKAAQDEASQETLREVMTQMQQQRRGGMGVMP